jgi:ABC-type oligopeptide transport system substrate-binding subunit
MGILGLIVVGAVITGVILSGRENQGVLPVSTNKPTQTSTVRPANPTATVVTNRTNTPRPPTATIVPSETPLPGTLILPIETFAKTIPWLPLDENAVPVVDVVSFNTAHPPFDNPLVRQAFAYAIDRQQIVDMAREYGLGDVELATTLTPPETLGRDLSGEVGISFDPQKAKELFSNAGYSDPADFPSVTFLVSATGTVAPGARYNMASAMAEMWKTYLGVTVQVQDTNWSGFFIRLRTDPPDLYWIGWAADYNDPDIFLREIFHSGSQYNYGNFANTEFDQLVDRAKDSNDPAERQELYIRAERILCETDVALIPIYHAK